MARWNGPESRVVIDTTKWIRADRGGFLQFHVRPGQVIDKDQPLATNTSLLGQEKSLMVAPFKGVILGMTTTPAVSPGEPVCHVGQLDTDTHAVNYVRIDPKQEAWSERPSRTWRPM